MKEKVNEGRRRKRNKRRRRKKGGKREGRWRRRKIKGVGEVNEN